REAMKKDRAEKQPETVKVDIAYTDTMGERYVVNKEVNLNPAMLEASASTMNGRGVKTSPMDSLKKYAMYGLIVLLLIVAYYGYKKFKGRKKKKR
ncbi:hypothetical protein ACFL0V_03215, partial [Nanoarchaeota archaeon]